MSTSKVCVLLAHGFEEIEAITIIDVLRRANVDVTTVGVEDDVAKGAHDIPVTTDMSFGQAVEADWDMIILPGGLPGATTLRDHSGVQDLLGRQWMKGRDLAAICAAPIALGKAGVLDGRKATCYPGFEEQLTGAKAVEERVVEDGKVITSRGPGTAMDFALHLVARLTDGDTAGRLREGMLVS